MVSNTVPNTAKQWDEEWLISMSPLVPARSAKTFHIPGLDGIRAIAFLIVFFSHDHLGSVVPGRFGVTVFFFLSGYLITTLMRIEIEKTGRLAIGDFYLRRSFRIFPPFYLVLVLIILAVKAGWLAGSCSIAGLAASALYMTNYWIILVHPVNIPGFTMFWSLSVEEHFYLIFPLLMLLMVRFKLRRKTQISILLALCATVLIWRCILVYHLHSLDRVYGSTRDLSRTWYATDTRVDSILFGCVLAFWGNPVFAPARKYSWGLAALGALGIVVSLLYRQPEFRETFRYTLQSVALIPFFVGAVRLHDHWAFSWLNGRLLRFIGILSYSLYLVHEPVLVLCQKLSNNRLIVGLMALSISVLLAYLIHFSVEKPLARVRRRLGSRTARVKDDFTRRDGNLGIDLGNAETPSQ